MNKTMYCTRRKDGTITKNYAEILNLQSDFYADLYSADPNVCFRPENKSGIRVDSTDKVLLESEISMEEIFDAMMMLKPNKVCGCDGISLEFYRKFWNSIKDLLLELFKYSVAIGELNRTGRRGIISLIPKKSKDNLLIRNWCPLALLNYDYKILAKLISNQLELVVSKLAGDQQNGFIKGHYTGENLMKTMEIVTYLHNRKESGIVAIVDFEKCFNQIEYGSIDKCFEYFGFGTYM